MDECREMGLTLDPPDVNFGDYRFVAQSKTRLVYGLGAIKGLGEGPIEALVNARQSAPFKDLYDFCQRVDPKRLNRRALEALISARKGHDKALALIEEALLIGALSIAEAQHERNRAAEEWRRAKFINQNPESLAFEGLDVQDLSPPPVSSAATNATWECGLYRFSWREPNVKSDVVTDEKVSWTRDCHA